MAHTWKQLLDKGGRLIQSFLGTVRSGPRWSAVRILSLWAVLLAGFAWAYWPTLTGMADRWSGDPQYSHGFLVPVFALALLWSRRELMPKGPLQTNWWGLGLLGIGFLCRFVSAYFYLEPLDGLSLLPTLLGLCLLLGGTATVKWCWPAVLFLGFMLPLPYTLEMALSQPLRRLATVASTFALQTLGFPAISEGNIIVVHEIRLGVIDACSGLGMLFTFFALATAVAIMINRPLGDRIIIFFSAIPIALVVNIIRITMTGFVYITMGEEIGHNLGHDLAGWLMMPLALGFLWLELKFLNSLFLPVEGSQPIPVALSNEAQPLPYPRKKNRPLPMFQPPQQPLLLARQKKTVP
jgi:exosortase